MIDEFRKREITEEERGRFARRLETQRLEDIKDVLATEGGRRLLHWLIYDEGRLQAIVSQDEQGRRRLASLLYHLLDAASPGSPEEIALEAKKQLILNNAEIEAAIQERKEEYEPASPDHGDY